MANFVLHFMTNSRSLSKHKGSRLIKFNRAEKHQKLLSGWRHKKLIDRKFQSVHSPRVGAGNAVVRFTSSTFKRVTAIDDAFAGYWKMPKSVVFFFNTCVWHGSHPEKMKIEIYDWWNIRERKRKWRKSKCQKCVSETYLERCCGKHSWLGRPEALEPGVLTDCDLVWWGDPYLWEININNSLLTRERRLLAKVLFSHIKLTQLDEDKFQMFPLTDKHNYRNSIHKIRRQMEDDVRKE